MDAQQELQQRVKDLDAKFGKDAVAKVIDKGSKKPNVEVIGGRFLVLRFWKYPLVIGLDHVKRIYIDSKNMKEGWVQFTFDVGKYESERSVKKDEMDAMLDEIFEAMRAADKVGMLMEDQ